MGDVIHALPVASAIHRAWPETQLTWVIDPRWAPLLEGNPSVAVALPFPRQKFQGPVGWVRAVRWFARLRKVRPEWVVDLQGLLRSGLMAFASRGRTVIGLSDAREGARFFHHRRVLTVPDEHAVLRYLRCLPPLGITKPGSPAFPLPPGTGDLVPADCVVLHPFARGMGKSLEAEAILAMVREFQTRCRNPLVVVGFGKVPEIPGVLDLTGRTSLHELIGIFRKARYVVSVDSGPMHLAAALGVPLLGIHTWSDPRLVGPFRHDAAIWQGGEIRRQDFRPPRLEKPFTCESAREVARFVATQIG